MCKVPRKSDKAIHHTCIYTSHLRLKYNYGVGRKVVFSRSTLQLINPHPSHYRPHSPFRIPPFEIVYDLCLCMFLKQILVSMIYDISCRHRNEKESEEQHDLPGLFFIVSLLFSLLLLKSLVINAKSSILISSSCDEGSPIFLVYFLFFGEAASLLSSLVFSFSPFLTSFSTFSVVGFLPFFFSFM